MDNSVDSQVKTGNRALVNTKDKGTVKIQTKEGTKRIQEVFLVPDLEQNLLRVGQQQNLLRVGQQVEHGYSVHFENGGFVIYDKGRNDKIIKSIKMEKN